MRSTENQNDMIEKVTLRRSDDGRLQLEGGVGCAEMNPKALLLYAGASCAGLTVLQIMKRERLVPKRFEITLMGDMTTDTVQAETEFRSFRVIYDIECADDREQIKASRAVKLGSDRPKPPKHERDESFRIRPAFLRGVRATLGRGGEAFRDRFMKRGGRRGAELPFAVSSAAVFPPARHCAVMRM